MSPNVIKVEDSEMKKANYPDTLRSGGLGPCIAIGVYDPKSKSGYMMHEGNFQYEDLDGAIQVIERDYGDLSSLKVFATGNSLSSYDDDEEQREYEIANRPFVEQILNKYFQASQLQIEWMPDDVTADLYLYTSNGEFDLVVERDGDGLDEMLE